MSAFISAIDIRKILKLRPAYDVPGGSWGDSTNMFFLMGVCYQAAIKGCSDYLGGSRWIIGRVAAGSVRLTGRVAAGLVIVILVAGITALGVKSRI